MDEGELHCSRLGLTVDGLHIDRQSIMSPSSHSTRTIQVLNQENKKRFLAYSTPWFETKQCLRSIDTVRI